MGMARISGGSGMICRTDSDLMICGSAGLLIYMIFPIGGPGRDTSLDRWYC